MLSLSTPGVLLVPAPEMRPELEPAIGPVRTISYPWTVPRETSVETSWVSWVLASKSLPLAAESRRWASAVARVASATEELVLLSTRPSVTWWRSTQPTIEITTAESSSVLITTRDWMDLRHAPVPARNGRKILIGGPGRCGPGGLAAGS